MGLLANHGRHGGELLRGHFRLQQQWPTLIECAVKLVVGAVGAWKSDVVLQFQIDQFLLLCIRPHLAALIRHVDVADRCLPSGIKSI